MKTAICPGSFDPITMGHMDVLERAAVVFDRVIAVVMNNPRKKYIFSAGERVDMIRRAAAYLPNVEVEESDRLLAEYCAQKENAVIVRGLRAVTDFELEFQMALMNRKLNPKLDTMFLTASERYQYLSSSVIKEVALFGGDVSEFVPPCIHDEVVRRIKG